MNADAVARAARHMLSECIKDACGEDVHLPNWVAGVLREELERLTAELARYQEIAEFIRPRAHEGGEADTPERIEQKIAELRDRQQG